MAGLLALGLLQMTADVLGLPLLEGLAAATGASPAPKVFSAHRGLETFSTRFALELTGANGTVVVPITPAEYARLEGPYNRRNPYGAVLAYGPVLVSDPRTRPMFEAVARHALCGDAPLLREVGIDPSAAAIGVALRLEPRPGTARDLPLRIEVSCT